LLAPAFLLLLAFGWGINWPVMKIALAEIPPWTFRGWSVLIAGLVLLLITCLSGRFAFPRRHQWPTLALASFFNITGWNLFVANGVMMVASGHAALLAYTMALWAVVIGWLFLGEPINRRRIVALLFGIAGVLVLMQTDFEAFGRAPLGAALCLGAAISWAIGTQIQKKYPTAMPVLALTGWQLVLGSLPILMVMPFVEGIHFPNVSAAAWLASASSIFISSALCYVLWFQIVRLLSVQVASISILLVPVIGVVSGALILDEPFGARELLAIGCIGLALVLVLYTPRPIEPIAGD
jgi:drug/metabolite transporter (DMT)-like permease